MRHTPLFILSLILIIAGDILWLFAIFAPSVVIDGLLLFSDDITPGDLTSKGKEVIRLLIGIIASLMWICGLLLLSIAHDYSNDHRKWIIISFFAWFIGDSLISLLSGFSLNPLLNFLALVAMLFTVRQRPEKKFL